MLNDENLNLKGEDDSPSAAPGSASSVGRSKTLSECSRELSEVWRKLFLTIAYDMKLDKLCDWLAKILRRFNR